MDNEKIVTFQLRLTRRTAWLLLTAFFICWHPGFLGSENLTLTTYYPAPYGGYVALLTTGKTLLARDPGGNVLIGMATQPAPATQKLDVFGNIRATGEAIGTLQSGFGQFRAIAGTYGAFIRNDGSDTYIPLLTASGDQYGAWNGLRPLRVNNMTGDLFLANSRVTIRHSDGWVEGLCTTVNYNGNMTCPNGTRVIQGYGTISCNSGGLLFLGLNLNDASRWRPYVIEGCAGSMLCCRIRDF